MNNFSVLTALGRKNYSPLKIYELICYAQCYCK